MRKQLLAIWKYLNKSLFITLLISASISGCSGQVDHQNTLSEEEFSLVSSQAKEKAVKKTGYNCDLNGLIEHPVKECSEDFINQLNSLTKKEINIYQEEVKKLKQTKNMEKYSILTKYYPEPSFLFDWMELWGEYYKSEGEDTVLNYGNVIGLEIAEYENNLDAYEIIMYMLNKREKLSPNENRIIKISQERSQCLKETLDYLKKSDKHSLKNKDVIDKCYKLL